MLGGVEMFRRVTILGGVATSHMAALHTEPQVHPRIAGLEALLARWTTLEAETVHACGAESVSPDGLRGLIAEARR